MINNKYYRMMLTIVSVCLVWSLVAFGSVIIGNSAGDDIALPVIGHSDIVDISDAKYSYSEMEKDLFTLASEYPALISVSSAGKSLDGREIYYAELGNRKAEKQILINAGIHGREYLNPMFVMNCLEYYLTNYYTGTYNEKTYREIFKEYKIIAVPMINPDGIMLSQEGLSAIRSDELKQKITDIYKSSYKKAYTSVDEYLKYWKSNAAGVDLNRNFGITYWSSMNTEVYKPATEGYKGPYAASEPETLAMISLTRKYSNLVCVISVHSQGEVIYWNSGQTGDLKSLTEDLSTTVSGLNGYKKQRNFSAPDATYDDWCLLNLGIPSLNIETGSGTCPLPISQYEKIWNDNYLILPLTAEYFG